MREQLDKKRRGDGKHLEAQLELVAVSSMTSSAQRAGGGSDENGKKADSLDGDSLGSDERRNACRSIFNC